MFQDYDAELLTAKARELHSNQYSLDAIKICEEALSINPNYNPAQVLKGTILLSLGKYDQAWPLQMLWRKDAAPDFYQQDLDRQWKGEKTNDLVVIRDDQAFGDCIQFLRYVPLIQEQCSRLYAVITPPLQQLFVDSFPNIPFLPFKIEGNITHILCARSDIATMKQAPITAMAPIFDNIIPPPPFLKAGKQGNGGIGFCYYTGHYTNYYGYTKFLSKSIPYYLMKPIIQ